MRAQASGLEYPPQTHNLRRPVPAPRSRRRYRNHVPQGIGGRTASLASAAARTSCLVMGHLAPDEGPVRQAGGAAFRVHGMFHQQDAQEAAPARPNPRGAKVIFAGRAKVFAHAAWASSPSPAAAEVHMRWSSGPAGEKEYGFMVHAGRHRVAEYSRVGRNKSPVPARGRSWRRPAAVR